MATKTITILEEAYTQLVNDKREDESFSDEILRWSKMKKRPDLRQFAGMWSDMPEKDFKKLRQTIVDLRKDAFKTRFKDLGYDV